MSPSPTNVESGNANMPPPKHSDAAGLSEDKCMPIAIIGMGFRGPADATDVNSLWKMLLEKREGYSPIPKKRWNNDAFYHPDYARHGAVRCAWLGLFIIIIPDTSSPDQCPRRTFLDRRCRLV